MLRDFFTGTSRAVQTMGRRPSLLPLLWMVFVVGALSSTLVGCDDGDDGESFEHTGQCAFGKTSCDASDDVDSDVHDAEFDSTELINECAPNKVSCDAGSYVSPDGDSDTLALHVVESAWPALQKALVANELFVGIAEVGSYYELGESLRDTSTVLRDTLKQVMDCGVITWGNVTVNARFDPVGESCAFLGLDWLGLASFEFLEADADGAFIAQRWTSLGDARATLNGSARVSYDSTRDLRNLTIDATFTFGDEEASIDGNLAIVRSDGSYTLTRTYELTEGESVWSVEAVDVEVEQGSAVPTAGSFVLRELSGPRAGPNLFVAISVEESRVFLDWSISPVTRRTELMEDLELIYRSVD